MIDRLLAPARRLPARRRTEAALGLILIVLSLAALGLVIWYDAARS